MNDIAPAQRLGRRMNHLLVDQSVFAWAHRILGFIGGSTLVISVVAKSQFLHWTEFSSGFGGSIVAVIFLPAAVPFVISYLANFDWVSERIGRMAIFLALLSAVALIVDAITVAIFVNAASWLWLFALYLGQASAYSVLGPHVLGVDDTIYLKSE